MRPRRGEEPREVLAVPPEAGEEAGEGEGHVGRGVQDDRGHLRGAGLERIVLRRARGEGSGENRADDPSCPSLAREGRRSAVRNPLADDPGNVMRVWK